MQIEQPKPAGTIAWNKLFWIISAVIIVLMPAISHSYGQTGDEWLQIEYGEHIWNYFFHHDKQALDYSNMSLQYQKQELYGGGFDFYMTVLHHWFPSLSVLSIRHFFNALSGAVLMVFTGLLAFRLTKKWPVAVVTLLFIIFSPRIFGESMNNPKDIPFAAGFIVGLYCFMALLEDFPARGWRYTIGIIAGWGLAFGVRSAGGLLLLGYFFVFGILYFLFNTGFKQKIKTPRTRNKLLLMLAVGLIGGYILGLLTWPWGLQDPIGNPIQSLKEMTNRDVVLRVLFEGAYRTNNHMPWYYEFKWICISNPVIVLAGVVLFFLLFMVIRKRLGMFVALILPFAAFFPLLYMIYKHSSVHDTWRHVFFVYPFWVIMGAAGIDAIGNFIKKESLKWLPQAIAIAGLLPAIVWTVRSHPNQYVYFNELEGGVKGAYGYYDIDYYQNSGLQAANWVLKNAHSADGKKIIVKSNLSGVDRYFTSDTAHFTASYGRYNERSNIDWDYFIAYSRYVPVEILQNNLWPPANAVHKVTVDDVPLMAVLARKSKESIEAYNAIQSSNFPVAVEKYGAFLQKDQSDDLPFYLYSVALANTNQVDPAIAAAKKAAEMDPSNIEYLQLLAKLYQAKGDEQNARGVINKANELIMAQQENNEE